MLQFCSCYGERADILHCRLEVPFWVFLLPSRVRCSLERESRASVVSFLKLVSLQHWRNCSWENSFWDISMRCLVPFSSDAKMTALEVSSYSYCLLVPSFALKCPIAWNTLLVELSSQLHAENFSTTMTGVRSCVAAVAHMWGTLSSAKF